MVSKKSPVRFRLKAFYIINALVAKLVNAVVRGAIVDKLMGSSPIKSKQKYFFNPLYKGVLLTTLIIKVYHLLTAALV